MDGPVRWLRLTVASPPMPVAMMVMVVMVAMMPAMPPIMVMMMVPPPMHFRRRRPGIFLNGCSGAGIAERHGVRRRRKREQRANGGEPENLRELHEISPSVLCHACSEWPVATLHAIWRPRVECALNERATKMNEGRRFAAVIDARAMTRQPPSRRLRGNTLTTDGRD